MTTLPPKRAPVTLNRLHQLITALAKQSGLPARRLNMRVASMMLAGALSRLLDDDGEPTVVTKGGIAMELRMGAQARATQDFDVVLRADPETLVDHLERAFEEPYQGFTFTAGQPEPLELRPKVRRLAVRVFFGTRIFTTLMVEVAPVEAGADEFEALPAHDLSDIGLKGPESVPVLALPGQLAQKVHALTKVPLREDGENVRFRDLIDLQLLEALAGEDLADVRAACETVFAGRDQQPWPPTITIYSSWPAGYSAMATELGMSITDVREAADEVSAFIARIADA